MKMEKEMKYETPVVEVLEKGFAGSDIEVNPTPEA